MSNINKTDLSQGVANNNNQVVVPPEQLKYADLLLYGSWTGIVILAVTFVLYVSGVLNSFVEPSTMPQYWGLKASEYLHMTNMSTGWKAMGMINHGDILSMVGILWLAALTIIGYAVILLPAYLKRKDSLYLTIVVVEVLVLVLAASGILTVGAH